METRLTEWTNEELWRLFPIRLTAHQPCWAAQYREERALLKKLLPQAAVHHIGSTAVETIWAKPIVDILAETEADCDWGTVKRLLLENGYLCMSEDGGRVSFNKGYTEAGFAERVFHLHLRRAGDHDELYFRDYLRDHLEEAKAYEQMKLALWKQFAYDRDAYTDAKTGFILDRTAQAKTLYGGRYEAK